MNVPSGSLGDLPVFSFFNFARFESGLDKFAGAMAAHEEFLGEGVDGLGADAVEADAELEDIIVIFGAGVDFGNAIDHFAQGNAAAEIAHADRRAFDIDLHLLAVAHDEFVDGVIDDFLEEDITAVVVVRAVADPPDIHAGAQADVFEGGKRLDFAFVVNVFFILAHAYLLPRKV